MTSLPTISASVSVSASHRSALIPGMRIVTALKDSGTSVRIRRWDALADGAPEDGVDRGIAAFVICASLIRQFEFAQNVWVNDPSFHELGNERDPIIGAQDGSYDMTIPKRPIRRKIKGLPAFTTVKGGAYFFLPGIKALHYLAALGG